MEKGVRNKKNADINTASNQKNLRKEIRLSQEELDLINERFLQVKPGKGEGYTLSEFIRDCAIETKIKVTTVSFSEETQEKFNRLYKVGINLFHLWQSLIKASKKTDSKMIDEVSKKVEEAIDDFDSLTLKLSSLLSGKQ